MVVELKSSLKEIQVHCNFMRGSSMALLQSDSNIRKYYMGNKLGAKGKKCLV